MARFIGSAGWRGFCGAAFALLALCPAMGGPPTASRAAQKRPILIGTIVGADKKPVRGATVYLYTAAPIKGTSPFCPSCYPDCQKSAVSDAQGRFRIASLDPNLRFQVLTVAKGFAPTFTDNVTPSSPTPVRITLPQRKQNSGKGRVFHGKITDASGKPVVGARIEPIGTKIGGTGYYGNVTDQGVDPLAVSDASGAFDLFCDARPGRTISLLLSGRGLANQTTPFMPIDVATHSFKMVPGATVRGVVKDASGQPMRSVVVGIVQSNRSVQTFVGNLDIGTNDSGEFLLTNVTPNQEYVLYGTTNTFGGGRHPGGPLYLPITKIRVGASGSTAEAGNLTARPARRLRGRVVLADNHSLPPQTRLLISREAAWDSRLVVLSKTGAFAADGIPDETMGLYVTVPGYHMSSTTKGYDANRQTLFVAAGSENVDDFQIVLEPDKATPAPKK